MPFPRHGARNRFRNTVIKYVSPTSYIASRFAVCMKFACNPKTRERTTRSSLTRISRTEVTRPGYSANVVLALTPFFVRTCTRNLRHVSLVRTETVPSNSFPIDRSIYRLHRENGVFRRRSMVFFVFTQFSRLLKASNDACRYVRILKNY